MMMIMNKLISKSSSSSSRYNSIINIYSISCYHRCCSNSNSSSNSNSNSNSSITTKDIYLKYQDNVSKGMHISQSRNTKLILI